MNVAVMLPNWIGDVVMATPALRALRQHLGQEAVIAGVMRPYVSEVLAGTDWLNHTIHYDRRSRKPELGAGAVVRRLRARNLDMLVLLTNSFRSAVIGWLSGASQRIGYVRYGRGPFLTTRLSPPRRGWKLEPIPAVDYYLQLAYAAGCPAEPPRLELATIPEDEEGATRVWESLKLSESERVIILNTGGARGNAKHWPIDYFIELARYIVTDTRNSVLAICGPDERDAAAEIERRAGHPRVKSMANQDVGLGVAKACIRRSQLMITTDSGPRHIATAFDVPVISMFGPIDPRWSETYHPQAINLQHRVPCGPCSRRTCPLGHHRCMRDLTVERVYEAVQRSLQEKPTVSAA